MTLRTTSVSMITPTPAQARNRKGNSGSTAGEGSAQHGQAVFYSFHYDRNAWRVQQIIQMGALEGHCGERVTTLPFSV